MAFGEHWEWRGFGSPSPACLDRLEALPRKFPTSQVLTDEYLWVPGASVNVKLRLGDLKLKRLVGKAREYERWVEAESDNHAFPIRPLLLEDLLRSLGIEVRSVPGVAMGRAELLDFLAREAPLVRLLAVRKERQQHEWNLPSAGSGEGVIVEVARILAPERIVSVGLEHAELSRIESARKALGLLEGLRSLSYLSAVAIWARDGTIAVP